jgi:protein phosphatase
MISTTYADSYGWASTRPIAGGARLTAAGWSDRGRGRLNNEDCFRVDEGLGLLLVADGMGGHEAGEVASKLASDTIVECLIEGASAVDPWPYGFDTTLSETGNRLRTAIQAAHLRLLEASLTDRSLAGMGTTVVAAIEHQGRLSVAWVGDSRLYIHGADGLRQVTRDDTWLQAALLENPHADADALRRHPLRNALTNVLGGATRTEVHVLDRPLRAGEDILLTTDGIHGTLDARHIAQLLSRRPDPAVSAADLVTAAISAGSTDNCTAIVGCYTR